MSWQCVVDGEQACVAIIENQTIRHCHFGAHSVAAEDHPWIKDRKLADGPVELFTFDGQVLPALRASNFETVSKLAPKLIRRNHITSDSRNPTARPPTGNLGIENLRRQFERRGSQS
jgi:hypothetical protein